MIKEELYIENYKVDLYADGEINRTITLNSLGNFTAKQSSYSNTIKLPLTAKNILIFEGVGLMGNTSTAPYRRLKCDYFYDRIPIFYDGYAIVNDVTSNSINITIYNGLIELGEVIKGKTLNDLNLSGLTHNFSFDEYKNIVDSGTTSNIQYSVIIDNVEIDEDRKIFYFFNNYNLSTTLPIIKLEYVFNKIFEEAGFEVEGELFTNPLLYNYFSTEYVTLTNGYTVDSPTYNIASSITGITSSQIVVESLQDNNDFTRTDYFVGDTVTSNAEISVTPTGFTSNVDSVVTVSVTPTYDINQGDYLLLKVYKNGSLNTSIFYEDNSLDGLTQDLAISVLSGDSVHYELESNAGTIFLSPRSNHYLDFEFQMDIDYQVASQNVVVVDGNDFELGKTKQSDLIKDVCNRYGLLLNKSQNENKIILKNVNTLINDKANAIDFSSKLNNIKKESFTNSYAQTNYLTFKEIDSDLGNIAPFNNFINYSFNLDNQLADSENKLFESPFYVFNKNNNIIPTIDDNAINIDLRHQLLSIDEESIEYYEPVENSIKLIRLLKSQYKYNYGIYFKDTPLQSINHYYMNVINPLSFDTVINFYYSDFLRLLEDYKTITVNLNLNLSDIQNFDFYKLIYLKQTGRYYYVNKMKYNVASPIAEAELVEIPF